MPHLVPAITSCSLSECRARLAHAHGYLAKHGADAIRRAAAIAPGLSWGSSVKRERVVLRQSTDQPDVAPRGEAHNLVEVINQCATMERLIDALDWLQGDESDMCHYTVERCHPTTTSAQSNGQKLIGDNDLVLAGPGRERAYFEVSDVVGDRDGNRNVFVNRKGSHLIIEKGAIVRMRIRRLIIEKGATCSGRGSQ